jgi:hypothetical protein
VVEDLGALVLPGARDPEDRDLLAGSWPSSRQALMTPRATMSTRVLETMDIITAILSTSGLLSTSLASAHVLRTDGLPPISQ